MTTFHDAIHIDRYNLNSFDPAFKRAMKNEQQGAPASPARSPGGRSASALSPQSSPARAAAGAAGEMWREGKNRHKALHSTGEEESPVDSGCWPLQIQSLSIHAYVSFLYTLTHVVIMFVSVSVSVCVCARAYMCVSVDVMSCMF